MPSVRPAPSAEADAIDGAELAAIAAEIGAQIAQLEQRLAHSAGASRERTSCGIDHRAIGDAGRIGPARQEVEEREKDAVALAV